MTEVKEALLDIRKGFEENEGVSELIKGFVNTLDIPTTDIDDTILDVISAVLFAIAYTSETCPEFDEFLYEIEDSIKANDTLKRTIGLE